MNGGLELSPGKDRPVGDYGRILGGLSPIANSSSIAYTSFELKDVPPVSVCMSSTASGYLNRRRRKQGMPLLTFGFASNYARGNTKRRPGLQHSRSKKMSRTTHYLSLWLILFMAGTICTFTTFVSERSRILLRQWRMEQSHPLSTQHMQQRRRRNLRTQTSPLTTFLSSSPPESSSSTKSMQRRGPKLRYLAFGSSFTWGSHSDSASSEDAYPYLLDPDVYSVALSGSLEYADFAAACTQSLLDGSPSSDRGVYVPDVITVEFTSVDILESHLILIQRLRRRFPNSIIVLVHVLDPMTHLFLQEDSLENVSADANRMNWREWKQALDRNQGNLTNSDEGAAPNALQSEDSIWELARSMIQATFSTTSTSRSEENSSRMSWTFVRPAPKDQPLLSSLLASDPLLLHYSHAANFSITATLNDLTVATQQMRSYLSQFLLDKMTSKETEHGSMTFLSSYGHEELAVGIRNMVEEYVGQKNHFRWLFNLLVRYRHVSPKLGDWGSGDDCHLWYTTGDYNVDTVGGTPANLPLVQISDRKFSWMVTILNAMTAAPHKHVLEFTRSQPFSFDGSSSSVSSYDSNINFIVVHNPFPTQRLLSLTYLTDADGLSYPKTRVMINDVSTVLIQPIHVSDSGIEAISNVDEQSIGIARTSGVGYVPPGKSIVRLVPLQSTSLPFRLLGASILAEEVQDLTSIEFALETDTLAASS